MRDLTHERKRRIAAEREIERLRDGLRTLTAQVEWFTNGPGSLAELVDAQSEARSLLVSSTGEEK